ncbi:hypothetical protein FALBO_7677 [Fusarium albosuccineum]|uniref:Uncharacterized protein n=1 Tax=Fusarium albosuccineum TaxID=1237068 RepID=A0A8H4LCJ4_9HYPO|nr:hypothetical protein FALBO_7677 [Fusarium albosuccineum]
MASIRQDKVAIADSTKLAPDARDINAASPHGLEERQNTVITRFRSIENQQFLNLASGAVLTVTRLSFDEPDDNNLPALEQIVGSALDNLGRHISEGEDNSSHSLRIPVYSSVFEASWSRGVVPHMTSIEWQAVLFAMYRALLAVGEEKLLQATFDLGGTALDISLQFIA